MYCRLIELMWLRWFGLQCVWMNTNALETGLILTNQLKLEKLSVWGLIMVSLKYQPRSVQCSYQTDPRKKCQLFYKLVQVLFWKQVKITRTCKCQGLLGSCAHSHAPVNKRRNVAAWKSNMRMPIVKEDTAINLFSSKMKSPSPVCSNMQSFSSLPAILDILHMNGTASVTYQAGLLLQ